MRSGIRRKGKIKLMNINILVRGEFELLVASFLVERCPKLRFIIL